MNRRHFIEKLTVPIATVCLTCLSSCSNEESDRNPQPTTKKLSNFTIDLNTELQNIDDQTVKNNVIVVRKDKSNEINSFFAFQEGCTHAGGRLSWQKKEQLFVCPVHFSKFNKEGLVVDGPASTPLKKYEIQISGNVLTVIL